MPKLKLHQDDFCHWALQRAFARAGEVDWSSLIVGLFADMGTGKTPAVIVLLEQVRKLLGVNKMEEQSLPSLIVCPSAVKFNWKAEFLRFAPWLDEREILIIDGPKQKQLAQLRDLEEGRASYAITNYEIVRIHQQWFQGFPFLAIVADEAHAIKNREARRTVAIKSIDARFRLALSGTPITNKPDDLWSILHFLFPGKPWMRTVRHPRDKRVGQRIRYRGPSPIWGSYWSFTSKYCEWEVNRFGSRIIGGRNLDRLHARLVSTNSMVRWRRSEVLSLEPIIYRYILLQPTEGQKQLYAELARGYAAYVAGLGAVNRMKIRSLLAQLTYFRRATTLTPREFALATGGHNPRFAPDLQVPVSDRGAKQEWLIDFIRNNLDSDKVLIFSDWTGCTRPLARRLEKACIETVSLDGSTPHSRRFDIQVRFNEDEAVQAFVGSPAAYEGLNLQAATYVVFMNLPWRPKDIFQAYSRCHRLGQEKQVTVIFPLVADTIDMQMAGRLRKKQRDIDLAIDNGEVNAAQLFEFTTKEQVLDMIGDGWL